MWISNAPIADVFVVWAKSEAHGGKIRGFVLEKGMEGPDRAEDRRQAVACAPRSPARSSWTASRSAKMRCCRNVEGLKGPFGCLNRARYGISWGVMGAAEFCWHAARATGSTASSSASRWRARSCSRRSSPTCRPRSRWACRRRLRVGRLMDEGRAAPEMISLIKRNNCGKALDIARMARDMHGGNGISGEFQVIRHMINLETVNTYEGTHDVHALILGRAQTGLQAFF
jgi:glutaryl-CoA dehydrogenase